MKPQHIPRAVGSIVFAVFVLSLGDAIIKGTSTGLPVWQMFFLRSVLVLIVLVAIQMVGGNRRFWPRSLGWTALRSLLLIAMWLAYYIALPHVPFATAAAGFYTLPLFIALFAAIFTGQHVSAHGWGAVVLGFAGVLMLLRPDANDFNAYALLPLVSAVLYAIAMLLTATKCRTEDPMALIVVLNLFYVAIGGTVSLALWLAPQSGDPFLWQGWVALSGKQSLALVVLAAAILLGGIYSAIAYQLAPAVTVSSFDYSYLVFAFLWGVLFFGEVPDAKSILGIVMIAGAGLVALRR